MTGIILTGHGGFDKLEYRNDLKVHTPSAGEVLIKVAAAAINNTDINTRIGWYSKGVKSATDAELAQSSQARQDDESTWSGVPLKFHRIQGADCCGRIVFVGRDVSSERIGERVLVRSLLRLDTSTQPFECWTFGSECDGAFAQYTTAPASQTYKVECDWTDDGLGSMPCAYSTAENMLHRAKVKSSDHLAKRRGALITAVGGIDKKDQLLALGATRFVPRGESVLAALGTNSIDVVVDLVAGPAFSELLDVLEKGGRYAVAGAIAGPIVELDVRTLYLKDLSFFGCTYQDEKVFANLISYIERGEIRPNVGRVYPLEEIVTAQKHFLSKATCGKLVLSVP